MNRHLTIFWIFLLIVLVSTMPVMAGTKVENRINSGSLATIDMIVPSHPRLWLRGDWDWDHNNHGSLAWRILHGEATYDDEPGNDQEKLEFILLAPDDMYNSGSYATYSLRFLWMILYAKAQQLNWKSYLPPGSFPGMSIQYNPRYTADEYFADAREKLMWLANYPLNYEYPNFMVTLGAVAYDWLYNEHYSNGSPVLSDVDKSTLQQSLIASADYLKALADGSGHFFMSEDIAPYAYVMVGLALYEPSKLNDPNYAAVNAKAQEYLDDFDTFWVGKILPALNAQGGDGGWHGGLGQFIGEQFDHIYTSSEVVPWHVSRILFAHYTATGLNIEESLYSTDFMKYGAVFQHYMIRPNGAYYDIGKIQDYRYIWIAPLRMYSRRRFSSDQEQQRIGELGDWVRRYKAPAYYVNAGSYDLFDQVMFEEKYPNPRPPEEIGFSGSRHFDKLGWVFMREGFTSQDDLSALFICQRYHWSSLNIYAQNSFTLERKGELIQGYENTIRIDGQGQRRISSYPTIADGVEAYAPDSNYDVGPGIVMYEDNKYYVAVVGDATNAYDESKLSKFLRSIVYLKADDIFIVFDQVETLNSGIQKSWLINPGSTPQSQSENLYKITTGNGALWINRLLPADVSVLSQTSNSFEIAPTLSKNEVYFLHVLQAADSYLTPASSQILVDDAVLDSNTEGIGISMGDWDITFNEQNVDVVSHATEVKLLSFKAQIENGAVILTWQMLSGKNDCRFEIERSIDNKSFNKIDSAIGADYLTDSGMYSYQDKDILDGQTYYYRLKLINSSGAFEYSDVLMIKVAIPDDFILLQNYPNPCNPSTIIKFTVPTATNVRLIIYDVKGRLVKNLVHGTCLPGDNEVLWKGDDMNGQNVPSGIYFYWLYADSQIRTKKMLLLR